MDGNEIRIEANEQKEEEHKKRKVKDVISDGWTTVKGKVKEGWDWTMSHKGEVLTAFVIAKAAISLGKDAGVIKPREVKKEENRKLRIYDPHTGIWHDLRRPLTTKEKIYLEQRSANGESYGSILSDFGVLEW